MCQGFDHLKKYLRHFVLPKIAASSIKVKSLLSVDGGSDCSERNNCEYVLD